MPRHDVMRHFFGGGINYGICTTRSVEIRGGWNHIFATEQIIQLHSVSLKEVNYVFPLYLYPNGKLPEEDLFPHDNGRRPNFSAAFIKDFRKKLNVKFVPESLGSFSKREIGPETIFHYAYAVFHSPAYRERYAQFLRSDFPRLPITGNFDLFRSLSGLGGHLVDYHARGRGKPKGMSYPVKGGGISVEEARYQSAQAQEPGRVWINDCQYFAGVPEIAWRFAIGGMSGATVAQRPHWPEIQVVSESRKNISESSGH